VAPIQPTESIDVQALCVGMFVHLDVGWMAHPFPRSSFRIADEHQLETIRALGLGHVRWCPELSEVVVPSADPDPSGLQPGATEDGARIEPELPLQARFEAAAAESARMLALVAHEPARPGRRATGWCVPCSRPCRKATW
jgi:hypothetical protein